MQIRIRFKYKVESGLGCSGKKKTLSKLFFLYLVHLNWKISASQTFYFNLGCNPKGNVNPGIRIQPFLKLEAGIHYAYFGLSVTRMNHLTWLPSTEYMLSNQN